MSKRKQEKKYKISILMALIDKGMTTSEIAKETGWGIAKVRYNIRTAKITIKHGNCNQKQQYAEKLKEKLKKYNWEEIRNFYETHTIAQTIKNFKITYGILKLAKKTNLIKIRDISECQKISLHKHTGRKPIGIPKDVLEDCIKNELTLEEMREKIGRDCGMIRRELKKHGMAALGMKSSRARKKRSEIANKLMRENKIGVARISNISYPCEYFKSLFNKEQIQYAEEYKPIIHLGRFFSIDIAFPDKKIGIEINGHFHYKNKKTRDFTDQHVERQKLIESDGWKIINVYYNDVFKLEVFEDILKTIKHAEPKESFNYDEYILNFKKEAEKFVGEANYIDYKEKAKELALTHTITEISKIIGSPISTIYNYFRDEGIPFKYKCKPINLDLVKLQELANTHSIAEMCKILGIKDRSLRAYLIRKKIKHKSQTIKF